MSSASEHEDRHGRITAELAGLSLELARDLQRRALETEDHAEAARLAEAFHKVSRGLRQTLALDMKLIRFRGELAREARAKAEAQEAKRQLEAEERALFYRHKQAMLDRYVGGLIWNEHERPEAERAELAERLEAWIAEASDRPDFADTPDGDLLLEACLDLGLDPAPLFEDALKPFSWITTPRPADTG